MAMVAGATLPVHHHSSPQRNDVECDIFERERFEKVEESHKSLGVLRGYNTSECPANTH